MKLSDWLLLALNAFLLAWAFIGFASMDEDALMVGAMIAMFTAAVNGFAVVHQRRRERDPEAKHTAKRARKQIDEMDPRTVLDIDARLEALERREREVGEADRIRQMIARGQQSVPAGPLAGELEAQARRERA